MKHLEKQFTPHQKEKQRHLIEVIRTKLAMFNRSGLESHLDSAVKCFDNLTVMQLDHVLENKLNETKEIKVKQFWKENKKAA
jgi:hypothetical protein